MSEDIKSMEKEEIEEAFASRGEPSYRAGQVYEWLHRGVKSFDEMTNIPKKTREYLVENYYISSATIEKKLIDTFSKQLKTF